jgi:hypothetical protein
MLSEIIDEGLESYDTREFKKEAYGWQIAPNRFLLAKEKGKKTLLYVPTNLLIQRP